MTREGTWLSPLDGLHAEECDGTEYSACRPVVAGDYIEVVYMAWCGDCGAADWTVV